MAFLDSLFFNGGVTWARVKTALGVADSAVGVNSQPITGASDITPATDGAGEIGTDAARFARVRAVAIASDDIVMRRDAADAHWTLREERNRLICVNHKTGQWFAFDLTPIDPPADAGTVEK